MIRYNFPYNYVYLFTHNKYVKPGLNYLQLLLSAQYLLFLRQPTSGIFVIHSIRIFQEVFGSVQIKKKKNI